MGIAYTNQPIFKGLIPASPPLTCLSAIHAYVTRAGWASVAYSNGHHYVFTSPQGLNAGCRIWYPNDPDFPNCLALQMVSQVDGDEGLIHHFEAGHVDVFTRYRIWVNCCSLFIGAPGITQTYFFPTSVSCGIPFAYGAVAPTPACSALSPAPATTSEIWWSGGDDSGRPIDGDRIDIPAFRCAYHCNRYSFGYNGEIRSIEELNIGTPLGGGGFPDTTRLLQLGVMKPAAVFNRFFNPFTNGLLFEDSTPMIYDPLLIENTIIYGQFYDACLESKPTELEATEQITDTSDASKVTKWINYSKQNLGFQVGNDDSAFFSLLLFTGTAAEVRGNLAY